MLRGCFSRLRLSSRLLKNAPRQLSTVPQRVEMVQEGNPDHSGSVFSAALSAAAAGLGGILLGRAMRETPDSPLGPCVVHAAPASGECENGDLDDLLSEDERRTIKIFEDASSSVLFVTNKVIGRPNIFSQDTLEVPQGAGSGFVWDDEGHIVTNFHVVRGANEVVVRAAGSETEVSCKLVGVDPMRDIAVLKAKQNDISATPLKPLGIGSSEQLRVGQRAIAIGNPFGLDHSLTSGVISALGRELPSVTNRPVNMIQTDASINPGSSGGPLLDSVGRVIGMNTMIFSPSGASAGIGFAIPVDTIKLSVSQIIRYGRPLQPGIGLQLAPDRVLRQIGVKGALVMRVTSNEARGIFKESVVDRRGRIDLGDIIIKINDTDISDSLDVFRAFEGVSVGDRIEVTFLRPNGRRSGRAIEAEERTARISAQDIGLPQNQAKL